MLLPLLGVLAVVEGAVVLAQPPSPLLSSTLNKQVAVRVLQDDFKVSYSHSVGRHAV